MTGNFLKADLVQLRDQVLVMGGEAENAVDRATRSLVERDSDLADQVLTDDDLIDTLELQSDQTCARLLALQPPEPRDLRFIITAIKISPILERIADHACNIARAAIDLNNEPQLKSLVDIPRMSRLSREMLRDALDAFAAGDAQAARDVIKADEELDALYDRIFHSLLDHMSSDQSAAGRAARLLLVAKHLERIGDYVTDICELIVYMSEARVIKHQK
jgi:phosphate transport system protein